MHDFEERLKSIISLQQKISETCQSIEDEIANLSRDQKGCADERLNLQQEQTNPDRNPNTLKAATERLNEIKDKLREVEENESAVRDARTKMTDALLKSKNLRGKENIGSSADEKKPEKRSLKDVIPKRLQDLAKSSRK